MSELSLVLLEDAVDVSAGRRAPLGTARDYLVCAVEFAGSRARSGEDAHAALLRLILDGSGVVSILYQAAYRARLADHKEPKHQ
ncbi:MAG TPA: hypothetical protein ENK57_09230 [Polyangiaceae bacterium]|nr:hypothetical protein [Polyangiaceae bacterium]